MDGKELTDSEAKEILKEARARLKLSIDAEADNRTASLDDLNFLAGEQWPEASKKARKDRPCLTINRLPQYVRQVVNEQRKTRPAIDIIPADGKAAKPTADVLQGMVRYIERSSRAKIAYDNAFEYAVACGIGHFRVSTEYYDDKSFEQDICIKRIPNPFSVYSDPASMEPDYSDGRYRFVSEMVEPDEFEARYGFEPTPVEEAGVGDWVEDWYEDGRVRVCEYWRIKTETVEIHQLASGQTIEGKADKEELAALGETIKNSRKAERKTVEQYIITSDKVIEKSEWKGKFIPIVTVIGGELNIEGKRKLTSLVRYAKDPARMYNYWASAETEVVALQPKAPWIGAAGSFRGHESQWARANTENLAYLEYEPVPNAQAPQRQFFPGVPQGIREGRMAAAEDIKSVIGMYDASLGAKSNETSGIAIKERRMEGDTGTYHYIDNHSRAIEQCGRIIVDLVPHIYDTPRTVMIVGSDDQEEMVAINQMFIDPATGMEYMHDLALGRYTVSVKVGASFESKRQEMTNAMIEIGSKNPQVFQLTSDLIFKNMDWPDAEEIAERLTPPQFKEGGGPPPPPPEVLAAQEEAKGLAQAATIKSQTELQKVQMELQADLQKAAKLDETQRYKILVEASKDLMIASQQGQVEEAKVVLDQQKAAAEATMAHQQAMAGKMQEGQVNLASLMQAVQSMAEQMNAPKEIVRDANGRAVGVRPSTRH